MSAAAGKAGAIISALAFNSLSKDIGTPAVLWSASFLHDRPGVVRLLTGWCGGTVFFACCVAGAVFTLLLPEVRNRDPDLVYQEELRERVGSDAGLYCCVMPKWCRTIGTAQTL